MRTIEFRFGLVVVDEGAVVLGGVGVTDPASGDEPTPGDARTTAACPTAECLF